MKDQDPRDARWIEWVRDQLPSAAPARLLSAVHAEVEATRRPPTWRIGERWVWRKVAPHSSARSSALAVASVIFAAVTLLAAIAVPLLGGPRPAPPFGLARPGFIAVDTADGVLLVRADGTDRHLLALPTGQLVNPTWSRDGLRLAVWHRAATIGGWSLLVVDSAGQHSTMANDVNLAASERRFGYPSNLAWSPDSREIAYAADVPSSTAIFIVDVVSPTEPKRITDPSMGATQPVWSSGGVIAYQSTTGQGLRIVRPDGSGDEPIGGLRATTTLPDWSPDGETVLTASSELGQTDIFAVGVDGSVVDVSNDPAEEFSPSWSPDGTRIAWARVPIDRSAAAYVVTANPDGSDQIEIDVPADLAPPIWSPDGTRLFSYVNVNWTYNELVVLDPNGVAPAVAIPARHNVGNGNWQRLP